MERRANELSGRMDASRDHTISVWQVILYAPAEAGPRLASTESGGRDSVLASSRENKE
jgi:hypothetical protein